MFASVFEYKISLTWSWASVSCFCVSLPPIFIGANHHHQLSHSTTDEIKPASLSKCHWAVAVKIRFHSCTMISLDSVFYFSQWQYRWNFLKLWSSQFRFYFSIFGHCSQHFWIVRQNRVSSNKKDSVSRNSPMIRGQCGTSISLCHFVILCSNYYV